MLCGLSQPMFEPVPQDDDPCKDLPKIAYNAAMEKYELYLDSLRNVFDTAYYNKCMKAKDLESFTVSYKASEYHYTLYYYDQAGNLVKTVPPAGVDAKHADATFLANVKTKRQNVRTGGAESSNILTPTHTLETEYRYNTLNQVIAQKTPDAGESKFWYDRLGRLVVSQNAKQYANARYSYTLYDELGRISQVGQKPQSTTMTETISRDPSQLATWLANNGASTNVQNKEEITRTVYDVSYFNGEATLSPTPLAQQNLRNRVSYTQVFDTEPNGADDTKYAGTHRAATYYSYDIHGNVDTLLQDYNSGIMASTGNRYKKMVYDYDLISGKVNQVAYQPGAVDAYYHRYTYDAENRVTDVETSHDGWIWEKDARYSYYKHGPLSRLILGQQQVQGLDYAYTLQGWLKGINSTSLRQGLFDMGGDGKTGAGLNPVARDVFGFSLNYFTNDYKPVDNTVLPFSVIGDGIVENGDGVETGKDLFNGNIASMVVNLLKLGSAKVYGFRYDQLNRLKAMNTYEGVSSTTNIFSASGMSDYKERLTYDANGNILTYLRNGTRGSLNLNDYTYTYGSGSNRLTGLYNSVHLNNYNYEYDEIGNVTKDTKQQIESASWNVYGKLQQVVKDGSFFAIEYSYDASGQRISKKIDGLEEWYVKDATGNTMATYLKEPGVNNGNLCTKEFNKYGSGLLGTEKFVVDVETPATIPEMPVFVRGITDYLLNDHRGNNMSMVTDKKLQHSTDGTTIDYYLADVRTASYYSAYGAISKSFNDGQIDLAHNGQKRSTEISASAQTALYWEYDGDVGRRWNLDPVVKIWESGYACFSNNPIAMVDPLGLDAVVRPKRKYKTLEGVTVKGKLRYEGEKKKTHRGDRFYHRADSYGGQGGWFNKEDYFSAVGKAGADIATVNANGSDKNFYLVEMARPSEDQKELAKNRLDQYLNCMGASTADDIFYQALYVAGVNSCSFRNTAVSGKAEMSSFNVQDMIGIGILMKALLKGMVSKAISYGISRIEMEVVKESTVIIPVATNNTKYAFGLKDIVPKFAKDIGAKHLMEDINWRQTFKSVISDPKNELHFTLDGIDDISIRLISDPGRSGINWELHTLYKNADAFERTIFYFGGKTYKSFEIFKIKPF
jgi:hypothetical protein